MFAWLVGGDPKPDDEQTAVGEESDSEAAGLSDSEAARPAPQDEVLQEEDSFQVSAVYQDGPVNALLEENDDSIHVTAPDEDEEDLAPGTPQPHEDSDIGPVARVLNAANYYEILGLSRKEAKKATPADFAAAYKRVALQVHPDKTSEEGAIDAFNKLRKALAVLNDEQLRATYDAELSGGKKKAGQTMKAHQAKEKQEMREVSRALTPRRSPPVVSSA